MGFLRRQILKWAYISSLGTGLYVIKNVGITISKSFQVSSKYFHGTTASITTSKNLTVA